MHVLQPVEAAVLALLIATGERHTFQSGRAQMRWRRLTMLTVHTCRGLGAG